MNSATTIIRTDGQYWTNETGNWMPLPESAVSYGLFLERLSPARVAEIEETIKGLPVTKTGDVFADLFAGPSADACRAAIGPDYDTWTAFVDYDHSREEFGR